MGKGGMDKCCLLPGTPVEKHCTVLTTIS